jgi:hypothetical protein
MADLLGDQDDQLVVLLLWRKKRGGGGNIYFGQHPPLVAPLSKYCSLGQNKP